MVVNANKPVVYHAEALDGDKSTQLLLDGQESISILPFDCDDKFFNITVTAASQQEGGKYYGLEKQFTLTPLFLRHPQV